MNNMAINLLPPKIKQEKKIKKIISLVSLFLIGIFIILLITIGGIFAADAYSKNDIGKIDQKIADQNSLLLRYKDTENTIKNINAKLQSIAAADPERTLWSNVLIEISNDTPTMIQIRTLTLNKTGNKIDISGYAETRSDIAKFKEKLENSKYFQNATFTSSVHNEEQGNFSYNISCELKDVK